MIIWIYRVKIFIISYEIVKFFMVCVFIGYVFCFKKYKSKVYVFIFLLLWKIYIILLSWNLFFCKIRIIIILILF